MITNFLKNGLSSLESIPIISSMQTNSTTQSPKPPVITNYPVQIEKIVEQTLAVLSVILSQRLGEKVETNEIRELADDVVKSKALQASLIDTKEKYNDLVNKSTTLYQQARKISNAFGEFISNINLFLQSQELMIPLKQIQKGISELQPEKVEKQMNYLIKIFTNNFQQVIDKNVKITEYNMNEEIKLLKNLNKNLESQIIAIKSNKGNDQSKYFEQTMKITTLNQKIAKLNQEKLEYQREGKSYVQANQEKQKIINDQEKQIGKLKQKENELSQKIKALELKYQRTERQYRERNNQSESLNTIIQKLKARQEQIVEELEQESRKRQSQHQLLRKRLYNEKIVLEEKVDHLNEKISDLSTQLVLKDELITLNKNELEKYRNSEIMEVDLDNFTKPSEKKTESEVIPEPGEIKQENILSKKTKMNLSDLIQKMGDLQNENKRIKDSLEKEKEVGVNKEVLKNLFVSYDDQSKEWDVRRNIKYQIYSLLDMKEKLPKPEQPKTGRWFGIF